MTPRSLTHQKVQFGSDTAARVHFFVTSQPQSASFRHVGRRVSSCGSHVKGVVCGKRAFAAMLARDAECVRLIQLEDMNERHCFPRVPCT